MCGIPWVNCAVICVKDDRKGSCEACAIACQNCTVYSVFPSGMTSHSKIAQFNWRYIASLMQCHKTTANIWRFVPTWRTSENQRGTVKPSAQGNVAFWMASCLLRDQGMLNIIRKFRDLEQKICLQTVSFVTVCIALNNQNVRASHRRSCSLNPSNSMWDIWWTR